MFIVVGQCLRQYAGRERRFGGDFFNAVAGGDDGCALKIVGCLEILFLRQQVELLLRLLAGVPGQPGEVGILVHIALAVCVEQNPEGQLGRRVQRERHERLVHVDRLTAGGHPQHNPVAHVVGIAIGHGVIVYFRQVLAGHGLVHHEASGSQNYRAVGAYRNFTIVPLGDYATNRALAVCEQGNHATVIHYGNTGRLHVLHDGVHKNTSAFVAFLGGHVAARHGRCYFVEGMGFLVAGIQQRFVRQRHHGAFEESGAFIGHAQRFHPVEVCRGALHVAADFFFVAVWAQCFAEIGEHVLAAVFQPQFLLQRGAAVAAEIHLAARHGG